MGEGGFGFVCLIAGEIFLIMLFLFMRSMNLVRLGDSWSLILGDGDIVRRYRILFRKCLRGFSVSARPSSAASDCKVNKGRLRPHSQEPAKSYSRILYRIDFACVIICLSRYSSSESNRSQTSPENVLTHLYSILAIFPQSTHHLHEIP